MIQRSHIEDLDGARRALVCAGGPWVYLTGIQPRTLDGDIKAQTRDALARLDMLMAEAGIGQQDLFTVTIWLKDMRYFSALNAVWNDWVANDDPPARTCVSGELCRPDLLVELVAVGYRSGPPS